MKNPSRWKQTIASIALIAICVSGGFMFGFYAASGTLPNISQNVSIAPPEMTKPSIIDVQNTLSEIDFPEYAEGYNCVDFVWEASRALAWQGQPSAIVAVEFETGPNHALLLVPTTDKGWVFIEPQVAAIVKPTVGGIYDGRIITSIRVLKMMWVPYEQWLMNPIFEEVINE